MLIRSDLHTAEKPIIIKYVDGVDRSFKSAFPSGKKITFTVKVPRRLGASAVVLRINRDGAPSRDIPLEYIELSEGWDVYSSEFTPDESGAEDFEALFYYEFLFLRGVDTLFTTSHNNVDFELSKESDEKFRMLIYNKSFSTPEWFSGKVMYHIFVDRFCRGEGYTEGRDDAVMNEDWDGGVPQFPIKRGDRYSNNVFFGGNLWGIAEKLDYLESLGVGVIYLSPIFKAYSNHKYDTGNYLEIDKMFGGEAAFDNLIAKAKEKGIRIILDGVFNHTGDDSLYFDKYGKYGGVGAYSDPNSPFFGWYEFSRYPEGYKSWWGIDILPKLNQGNPDCRDFFVGEAGVIRRYIERGIGGWRLDVADELPNEFLDKLRETAKETDPESVIIGEVWENAVDKISYGKRRRYFGGRQLDSVMNYPVKSAVVEYMRSRDASILADTLTEIYSLYPDCVCHSLMNLLGTHDTERIITVLGVVCDESLDGDIAENSELAYRKMTNRQRRAAKELLLMAAVIQFTVFGVPSVYYGDEIGLEGYHDPFCRMPYPWGREDEELLEFYRKLGEIRKLDVFARGDFKIDRVDGGFIAYSRFTEKEKITVLVNRGERNVRYEAKAIAKELISGKRFDGTVKANTALIIKE
ncbi:MAG: glycoside hydrolase family 13 protein [Clostridia bacterium]|nr:glycoside hydrolase family 13 protein [Clostridia bacterium]